MKLAKTSVNQQSYTTLVTTQPPESENKAEKCNNIGNSLPPSKKPAYHVHFENTTMETVEVEEDEDESNYPNGYSTHHPPRLKDPPQL